MAHLAALLLLAGKTHAAPPKSDSVLPSPTWQRGEQLYARCIGCHAIEGHRTGPEHCGLFGRRAGGAPGFEDYSDAMQTSKLVWNTRTLDAFLKAPLQALPGTSMGYAGIKDDHDRSDLIAWLRQATQPGLTCKASPGRPLETPTPQTGARP